jgi:hypothetical protein
MKFIQVKLEDFVVRFTGTDQRNIADVYADILVVELPGLQWPSRPHSPDHNPLTPKSRGKELVATV